MRKWVQTRLIITAVCLGKGETTHVRKRKDRDGEIYETGRSRSPGGEWREVPGARSCSSGALWRMSERWKRVAFVAAPRSLARSSRCGDIHRHRTSHRGCHLLFLSRTPSPSKISCTLWVHSSIELFRTWPAATLRSQLVSLFAGCDRIHAGGQCFWIPTL